MASSICKETSASKLGVVRHHYALICGLTFIALASFYDAFLVFKYRNVITEHNPICEWLINQEPEYVSLFLLAKITSTLVVVALLGGLYRFRAASGIVATGSLVAFQVVLMGYIHHSEPIPSKRNANFMVAMFSGKATTAPTSPFPKLGTETSPTIHRSTSSKKNRDGRLSRSEEGKRKYRAWRYREMQRKSRARTRHYKSRQEIARSTSDAL